MSRDEAFQLAATHPKLSEILNTPVDRWTSFSEAFKQPPDWNRAFIAMGSKRIMPKRQPRRQSPEEDTAAIERETKRSKDRERSPHRCDPALDMGEIRIAKAFLLKIGPPAGPSQGKSAPMCQSFIQGKCEDGSKCGCHHFQTEIIQALQDVRDHDTAQNLGLSVQEVNKYTPMSCRAPIYPILQESSQRILHSLYLQDERLQQMVPEKLLVAVDDMAYKIEQHERKIQQEVRQRPAAFNELFSRQPFVLGKHDTIIDQLQSVRNTWKRECKDIEVGDNTQGNQKIWCKVGDEDIEPGKSRNSSQSSQATDVDERLPNKRRVKVTIEPRTLPKAALATMATNAATAKDMQADLDAAGAGLATYLSKATPPTELP